MSLAIKIMVIVAIIAIGIFIYQSCAGTPLIQRIDKNAPDAVSTYQVSTVTRIYYAKEAVKNPDGSVTLTDWYLKDRDKWEYHTGKLTIPPPLHPVINR